MPQRAHRESINGSTCLSLDETWKFRYGHGLRDLTAPASLTFATR